MKTVKANDKSLTGLEINATESGIVDVVIERTIMLTYQQWFSSDEYPVPSADLHHEGGAKASNGISAPVGSFPVFSDCGHQRLGRHPRLHSGATAAFGFYPPLHPNILQTSV